ncbi:MAG: hypothetical protein ABI811_22990 [Acidobacteriota bacterium]
MEPIHRHTANPTHSHRRGVTRTLHTNQEFPGLVAMILPMRIFLESITGKSVPTRTIASQIAAMLQENYPELEPLLTREEVRAASRDAADIASDKSSRRDQKASAKRRIAELKSYLKKKARIESQIASDRATDRATRDRILTSREDFAEAIEIARAVYAHHPSLVTTAKFPPEFLKDIRAQRDDDSYKPHTRIEDLWVNPDLPALREETRAFLRQRLTYDLPRSKYDQDVKMTEEEVVNELSELQLTVRLDRMAAEGATPAQVDAVHLRETRRRMGLRSH